MDIEKSFMDIQNSLKISKNHAEFRIPIILFRQKIISKKTLVLILFKDI